MSFARPKCLSWHAAAAQEHALTQVINRPAEFINSWNNTLSGFTVVSTQNYLTAGFTCDLNGWVGQVSVQAADFSVLAIAVVTFLTITFNARVLNLTVDKQRLVCAAVWVIPLATASIAAAMNKIEPVTGNWCWISREPLYLRYVLGHGWRFAIFCAVIGLYLGIFLHVRRRLAQRNNTPTLDRSYSFGMYTDSASDTNVSMVHNELIRGKHGMPTMPREAVTRSSSDRNRETGLDAAQEAKQNAQQRLGVKPRIRVVQSSTLDHDTKHWLLLSLFPLAYILVWIPGLANRFAELVGYQADWLIALQATTQLTGLVNALVYGFREHRELHKRQVQARERKYIKELDLDV